MLKHLGQETIDKMFEFTKWYEANGIITSCWVHSGSAGLYGSTNNQQSWLDEQPTLNFLKGFTNSIPI